MYHIIIFSNYQTLAQFAVQWIDIFYRDAIIFLYYLICIKLYLRSSSDFIFTIYVITLPILVLYVIVIALNNMDFQEVRLTTIRNQTIILLLHCLLFILKIETFLCFINWLILVLAILYILFFCKGNYTSLRNNHLNQTLLTRRRENKIVPANEDDLLRKNLFVNSPMYDDSLHNTFSMHVQNDVRMTFSLVG